MADKPKKEHSKKGSGKSKRGKGPDPVGKQQFSTDSPSTECELGPPSLTPQKSSSDALQTNPRVDPSVSLIPSEDLAGPSTDCPGMGPFQGQDDSTESIMQAGDFHHE